MAPGSKVATKRFDRARVASYLSGWYQKEMESALRKPRPPKDAEHQGGTVFDIQPEMASTKAVRVLLELADILGFEPTKTVIKKGGYQNKDEFVKELSSRIEQAFDQHYETKPPASAKAEKEVDRHAHL
jgi:hypothetical protein